MITARQCVAARALLDWSGESLANKADVGIATVRNFENSRVTPRPAVAAAIQRALEDGGVSFDLEVGKGPGVRLKKAQP